MPCRPPPMLPTAEITPEAQPPPSPLPARPGIRLPPRSSPALRSPSRSRSTRTSQRSLDPGQCCTCAGSEPRPPWACTPSGSPP
eukprot:2839848-Rhodomonas_salina.2